MPLSSSEEIGIRLEVLILCSPDNPAAGYSIHGDIEGLAWLLSLWSICEKTICITLYLYLYISVFVFALVLSLSHVWVNPHQQHKHFLEDVLLTILYLYA